MSTAPLGILGGTFDPVHIGHLRLGEELAEALGLAEVRFVPSGRPPHRVAPQATAGHRLAMVRLALAGNARFVLDDREARRDGPCYTFDTLNELRAERGPDVPLVFLLGADAFIGLSGWHRWQELFELAHLAVAHRPGFPPERWAEHMPAALAREFAARRAGMPAGVQEQAAGHIVVVPVTALDISASGIRERLAAHASVRYLLPDPVIDYIEKHHLYG